MIIPCIDLMDGKVVQLRQGREKVLEGKPPDEMLQEFSGFPQIQVIDLDAAMGRGSNSALIADLAGKAKIRAGGGIRTASDARKLLDSGAYRVIVGTAAFTATGLNHELLGEITAAVGAERITVALDSRDGQIVVKGWRESTQLEATSMLGQLSPYCSGFLCTYVDKEGLLQGTDLAWFEKLRSLTDHELIAAGGITTINEIESLSRMHIHCALGMAIYVGRLSLNELAQLDIWRGDL